MNTWLATTALCLATALSIQARGAEDRPPILPTRDVGVIYRVLGGDMGDSTQKLQVTYADNGDHIRLDFFRFAESKFPYASWIYDGITKRLIVVRPEQREYVDEAAPEGQVPGSFLTPDMALEKQRMIAVAGQPCTNWTIKAADPVMNGMLACLTDEGVLLQLGSADPRIPPRLAALIVRYGPPPDGVFSPPAGFMRVRPRP
jgi:hypothetical protein